ncbi:MAG: hypothetical protein AAF328_00470 [Planctomycetota bacterium]
MKSRLPSTTALPARFSTRRHLMASCLGLSSLATTAQAGDLVAALDAAPTGAEFVLVVPSMQDTSDAVADLAELFGSAEPEMLDLLGSFKQEMGISAGLDDGGSAVVIMTGLADAIANGDEPEPIVLLPVSDYAAFVESIGGSADGVTTVMLEGDDGFAKQVGNFAVLGENQAAIEAYAAGQAGDAMLERVGTYGANDADDAAMAGFVDVAALRPILLEQIDVAVEAAKEDFRTSMDFDGDQPISAESVESLIDSYADLGRVLLNGVDAAVFSWNSDDAGIDGAYAWNVVEGSKLSTYLTGERAEFASLLNQMPASPYIFAVAADTTAFNLGGMSTDMIDAVGMALGDEPMFAGIMTMVRESMTIYEQMNAGAQVFYAPDMAAMMGGGVMKTLSIYDVDDTDASIELIRAAWAKMPGLIPEMMAQLPDAGPASGMDFTFDWTESALTLNQVDVHQYDLKMVLPPEMMAELGPAAMMMGNAGTSGYIAGVDGKIIMTTVPDPNLMREGLDALENGGGLGEKAVIQDARGELPEGSVLEMFVSLDGIAEAANPFMMMFAGGMQLDVPEDLAPVSVGLGLDGTAMGARVVIPMSVLEFVRDSAQQAQEMMQPAGGDGGGNRAPF